MKISEDTLSILNNFSSINGSIAIKEGSDISTMSDGKSILAKAAIEEEFPQDFCIYELHKFLSAISLLEDPTFSFNNEHVDIGSGDSKKSIRYGFTDPTLITLPPKNGKIEFPDAPDVQFLLGKGDLKNILKASAVLDLPHFCVNGVDGLSASVTNMATPKESNAFDLDLSGKADINFSEDFENSEVFNDDYCMTFLVENLKIFPGDYLVELSNEGIGHFINQDVDVEYWIAPDAQYSSIIE